MNLYLSLLLITVTIKISKPIPNTDDYGLASCTGVFVSDNEILTARHCMKESRGHQWIKTADGVSHKADIEAISKEADLALLRIPDIESHPYATLGRPVHVTESVYTVNSGDGIENTYNTGIVCNMTQMFDDEPVMVMHNASILGGASGSGLFDKHGRLIGINIRGNNSFALAVNEPDIQKFLDENHAY